MTIESSQNNNKRIAKNTLLLYLRTIFIMFISLYTSRVVLNALGVENYGIYNVVGGVVAMFSLISGSLSSSISRFITFELGKGNIEKKSDLEDERLVDEYSFTNIQKGPWRIHGFEVIKKTYFCLKIVNSIFKAFTFVVM